MSLFKKFGKAKDKLKSKKNEPEVKGKRGKINTGPSENFMKRFGMK